MAVSNAQLLWASLKNTRFDNMNRDMVGYGFERVTEKVTPELIDAFARATNDLNPLYAGDNAIAPPLYLSRLVFPMIKEVLIHKDLHMNILRMVHAFQGFTWHGPIRPGDELRLKVTISDLKETSAGELLELRGGAYRGDELVAEAFAKTMVRAKKRKGPKKEKQPEAPKTELFRLDIPLDSDQALRYAIASTDTNFIHTSNMLAKLSGLPRTILHGLCTMAMTNAHLTGHLLQGDVTRVTGLEGRFSHPAFPGETLTVVGYEGDDPAATPFEVINRKGKPIITNGVFRHR